MAQGWLQRPGAKNSSTTEKATPLLG